MGKHPSKFKKFVSRISKIFSRHSGKYESTSSAGGYETQVLECGEADLHAKAVVCTKNPGHAKFIPIKSFNLNHLPAGHRDLDLYGYIKAVADLTVRVDVVISGRPESRLDTDNDDSLPHRGEPEESMMSGTGEIDVHKFIDGRGFDSRGNEVNIRESQRMDDLMASAGTCPCRKCFLSETPSSVWWEISVRTAAHVVYDHRDNNEAKKISCKLFYDDEDSQTVRLDHLTISFINVEVDRCKLRHVTCDPLGERLFSLVSLRHNLWVRVWNKYVLRGKSARNTCVIVSHPHGCYKQVSIGQWIDINRFSECDWFYDSTRLTYTTCTCPGSSGASVYCPGIDSGHVHGGSNTDKSNYSGIGYSRKPFSVIEGKKKRKT